MSGLDRYHFNIQLDPIKNEFIQAALEEAQRISPSKIPSIKSATICTQYFENLKKSLLEKYPNNSSQVEIFMMCNEQYFFSELSDKICAILKGNLKINTDK